MFIDIDSPGTWPESLATAMASVDRQTALADYPTDLEIDPQDAARVRAALGHTRIRARHFTRLLPHEVKWIRDTGLRLHSRALFDERIAAAAANGYFDAATAEVLRSVSIPAAEADKRGDRDFVCLTIGPVAELSPHSVAALIGTWGGEGVYFASGAKPYRSLLQGLGRPTAVHVGLSLADESMLRFWPPIEQLLLGRLRNLPDNFGDVFSREPIPASAIIGLRMMD